MNRTAEVVRTPRCPLALAIVAASAGLLAGCAGSGGGGASPSSVSGKYLLALGDSDLPSEPGSATTMAGRPGAKDALTVISLPIREPSTPFAQADVSSSALGSPGQIAVTPDGRYAYIVETRGASGATGPTEIAALPMGDSLTAVNLSNPLAPVVIGKSYVGPDPRAVAVNPVSPFIAVVTTNPRRQLIIAPVEMGTGAPDTSVSWPLNGLDDDEAAPTAVAWHPSGRALAVSLGERSEVIFYRFKATPDGLAIAPWGGPVGVGKHPIAGTFTRDGRHFISLDAGSPTTQAAGAPMGPGRLTVVRLVDNLDADLADADHTVVGTLETGIRPVGMALSPDGTLVAVANAAVSVATSTTAGGSVTLARLDRSGALTSPTEFVLGAVPAGVAFDASGRFLCVSQYASLDPEASDGEVSFWKIVRKGSAAGLEQQDYFLGIGGGPHSALIVR